MTGKIPSFVKFALLFAAVHVYQSANSRSVSSALIETTYMHTRNDSFPTNPVIAHRGAWKSGGLPQNSIASLQAAIALGAAGSETDLHMTADGYLIIHHDPDVENGAIIQKTRKEELDHLRLSNGEPLPLLQDFLQIIKSQSKTRLILELKPSVKGADWAMETVRKTVQEVEEQQALPWIVFISFDFEMCREIVRLLPHASVQYLNGDKSPAQLKEAGINGMDYHHSVYKKHPAWIEQAKEAGITLNAWTVNTAEDMRWFLERKFDQITTDQPELLMSIYHLK